MGRTAEETLNDALSVHRRAFADDPWPSVDARIARLERLADAVWARREGFAAAIAADFGHRSAHETLMAEVGVAVLAIRHLIRHLPRWASDEARPVAWMFFPASARIVPQPLGVVGVISPWNYPLQLAAVPVATALAAGNRVMLKPSELTPATSALLAEVFSALYPVDLVSVHTGGADVGEAFAGLPLDHILFTGSTAVGRKVMAAAARHLTPLTLELGGKSPAILGPGGDLDRAAARIAHGKLLNAGQTCIAPDYALVPAAKRDTFVDRFRGHAERMFPNWAHNPDYTSIANERHYRRLTSLIDDAASRGATVVQVGGTDAGHGNKLPPTLLLDVTDDMAVMQDEIFGPVLPVRTYQHLDDVVATVNAGPRPLAMYVFDDDPARIDGLLRRTHAGGVTINDTLLHIAQDDLPFGGVGASGMGAYHGREGFDRLSHRKAVFEQSRINGGALLHPPYGRGVERLVAAIVRLARG